MIQIAHKYLIERLLLSHAEPDRQGMGTISSARPRIAADVQARVGCVERGLVLICGPLA